MVKVEKVVPRHIRFNTVMEIIDSKPCDNIEVKVVVPLVVNGKQKGNRIEFKKITAREHYAQFKLDDFKLSNMIEAGVPLELLNVNMMNQSSEERISNFVDVAYDAYKNALSFEEFEERLKSADLTPSEPSPVQPTIVQPSNPE